MDMHLSLKKSFLTNMFFVHLQKLNKNIIQNEHKHFMK